MAFDLSTAVPVEDPTAPPPRRGKFDITTARPVTEIEAEQAQVFPSQPTTFPQALGLGLRDTVAAALQGVNAATGGFLKSAYERPIAPNSRLESFGYTPQPTNRVFPTPITPEGKLLGTVDTVLGSVVGLPGKAFMGTAKGVAKVAPKLPQFVQRAIAGGVGGVTFDIARPETYLPYATTGAIGSAAIPPVISGVAKISRKPPRPQTIPELMQVPESEVARLSPKDQQTFFSIKRQQLVQRFRLRDQELKVERNLLNREFAKVSTERALNIRQRLEAYLPKRSQHFRDLFEADMAGRQDEVVPIEDLRQFLLKRYAKDPETLNAVSARLGLSNEPLAIPVLNETGEVLPETRHLTKTLGELYQQSKNFGQTLPQAVRQSLRLYNADEYMTDRTIGTLIDFLETKGVNLQNSRGFWRETTPIVDQAVSEFRPFLATGTKTRAAASRLRKLSLGIDEDNKLYGKTLANYLEIDSLPGGITKIVSKLSANEKAQLALQIERTDPVGSLGAAGPLAQAKFIAGKRHEASVEKWRRIKWILGILTAGSVVQAGISGIRRMLER